MAKKLTNKVGNKNLDKVVAALDVDSKSMRDGPLHFAASNGAQKMCRMLLKDYNCDPNLADANGTVLCFCCDFCLRFSWLVWLGLGVCSVV